MKRLLYAAAIVIVGVIAVGCWWMARSEEKSASTDRISTSRHVSAPKPQIPPQPVMSLTPDIPLRLQIPKLKLDLAVEQVGLTAENDMAAPKEPMVAGWFKNGYLPGSLGNAVIAAHSWHTKGRGAFADLEKLEPGDTVVVITHASAQQYSVTSLEKYPAELKTTGAIFGPSKTANLNLITCAGRWNAEKKHYEDRLVAHTSFQKEDSR